MHHLFAYKQPNVWTKRHCILASILFSSCNGTYLMSMHFQISLFITSSLNQNNMIFVKYHFMRFFVNCQGCQSVQEWSMFGILVGSLVKFLFFPLDIGQLQRMAPLLFVFDTILLTFTNFFALFNIHFVLVIASNHFIRPTLA